MYHITYYPISQLVARIAAIYLVSNCQLDAEAQAIDNKSRLFTWESLNVHIKQHMVREDSLQVESQQHSVEGLAISLRLTTNISRD